MFARWLIMVVALAVATPPAAAEPSRHNSSKHTKKPAKRKRSKSRRAKRRKPSPVKVVEPDPPLRNLEPPRGPPDPEEANRAGMSSGSDSGSGDASSQPPPPTDLLSTDLPAAEPAPASEAATPSEPAPPAAAPPPPATTITTTAPRPATSRSRPTWYVALRGGPALVDRRGFNEYRSNRQIYDDERNLRGELAIGRFLSRRLALGIAAGGGPFPKFDAPDPLYDVNTRYSVVAAQARLDLELHTGWFVLALGAGGAYERASGTFATLDPDTFQATPHTSAFTRFGALGAAQLGVQMQLGHVAIELLAGASAIKLLRGTYEHEMASPGPSDREMAYVGSLLLGLRLQ